MSDLTKEQATQAVVASAIAFVAVDSALEKRSDLHEVHAHLRLALHAAVRMLQEAGNG